jgi:CRISPR/Cas system CMR subunit Cmr6 (Cas7 group RAMP superfamily)
MVKFYSDITKKVYENAAAAKEAEEKLEKEKIQREDLKKQMTEKIEYARKNLEDIQKEYRDIIKTAEREYNEAIANYCKEFGEYRVKFYDDDELNLLWNFFSNWTIR